MISAVSDEALDHLEQQIPGLGMAALDGAYLEALVTGQTVLVSGDGWIYQAFPDGSKKLFKTTPAR